MKLHLVDATYELFRAHYAPRPPVHGRDGMLLSGVSGVVEQLLFLLREERATHVGCATDHVIESFRNDMWPGYKSSAGMPPELLAQFPIVEDAIRALGLVVWPMVKFEADDAIAAACTRFRGDASVDQVLVCTPDKDMAQLVDDAHVVLFDRRRRIVYDEAAVIEKWGVRPPSIPDWLALVGDSADGFPGLPGWGAKSAAAVLFRWGSLEGIPARASEWDVPSLRGGPILAATLREQWANAQLFRSLARLRTDADGVEIPQRSVAELEWHGAPKAEWQRFCDQWGLDRLRDRPHRWLASYGRAMSDAMTPAQHIDALIAEHPGWTGDAIATLRRLIHEADPEIEEYWKWVTPNRPGTPTWEHGGIVCHINVLKGRVRITLRDGAHLPDPHHLYNANLDSTGRRAIDIPTGSPIDEDAIRELVRLGVEYRLAVVKAKGA